MGDGRSIFVWTERWIDGAEKRNPLMKNILVDLELRVSDLIDHQNKCWNMEKLEELFYDEDIRRILEMRTTFNQKDYWVWLHNRNGSYSAKSGYWFINFFMRGQEIQEEEARPSLNVIKEVCCGAAWAVRNDAGKVILHSRRAFSSIPSKEEAILQVLVWTIECMNDHHFDRVIFAMEDDTFTKVILRSKEWPNFRCQQVLLMDKFSKLRWWRLIKEDRKTNRGAFLIAQSVIKFGYLQSYVAAGFPRWMDAFFENEEVLPSV
ncbi:hypothetical protein Bca52824_035580 [Brassica carinata]|uniref:RNase H type-1 domain-containing protein n=1 Tax=Brassica carinata TaxID=52824 RepID=A0A8X7S0Y8_BRACI|nr:hypothetical protein Bca52824_035580 [Brassica carinata]